MTDLIDEVKDSFERSKDAISGGDDGSSSSAGETADGTTTGAGETASAGAEAIASAAQVARSISSPAGAISETMPISCARWADIRSWLPSSESRMISGNGMIPDMWIGS